MYHGLMDMFFDIMNIRETNSPKFELKPSLPPFSRVDHPRYSWLRNVLLQHFEDWLIFIEQRPGVFLQMQNVNIPTHI